MEKKKNPGGRPSKYDKHKHPAEFIEHSRTGKSLTQIAAIWGVSRECIYQWGRDYKKFSDALELGRGLVEAWYTNLGVSAMLGQAKINGETVKINLGMYIWMSKNVCKWSDRIDSKSEVTGKDGAPLQVNTIVDLVKELEKKED